MTRTANEILRTWLKASDRGLEIGSGWSTIWFAQRVGNLISIEHDPVWYARISEQIRIGGLSNVDYRLIPVTSDDGVSAGSHAYVGAVTGIQDNSLDFVLVDGILRSECANAAVSKIHSGGVLILDNAERYLPSQSAAPYARRASQGAASQGWIEFLKQTNGWRSIWTSNGVWDTLLCVKPCDRGMQCGCRG